MATMIMKKAIYIIKDFVSLCCLIMRFIHHDVKIIATSRVESYNVFIYSGRFAYRRKKIVSAIKSDNSVHILVYAF